MLGVEVVRMSVFAVVALECQRLYWMWRVVAMLWQEPVSIDFLPPNVGLKYVTGMSSCRMQGMPCKGLLVLGAAL
jgi:hypothetical protein